MQKIISTDFYADFGFLKKPDTNDPVYLTYNMLHKPALLGILGAILGLGGFSEAKEEENKSSKPQRGNQRKAIMPEYYQKLSSLKIGIKPLRDGNGNFSKTIIKYNNAVGYANKDEGKNGATLNIVEQTLIKPSYRCYLLLDDVNDLHKKLYNYMQTSQAVYLPYLGKNEYSLWWDNFQVYDFRLFSSLEKSFKLSSIFIKEEALKDGVKRSKGFKPKATPSSKFMYFENLPVDYNLDLIQYNLVAFAYTDWELIQEYQVNDLYELSNDEIIQLF